MRGILRNTLAGIVTVIFVAGCTPVQPATARELSERELAADAWMDVSLGPPFVAWFNRTARANDIARVDHLNQVDLLDQVTVGRKLVVFKSIQEAEAMMSALDGRVDVIGYNLENGPGNLASEQRDPIGSVRRMQALADRYDVLLAVGPDHDFALSDGVAMAVYADIMILQVQRVQSEPRKVLEFVLPLAEAMREANPAVEVSAQVAAQGSVTEVADLIRSMAGSLDGISILTDHEDVDFSAALANELRSAELSTVVPTPVEPAPTRRFAVVSPTAVLTVAEEPGLPQVAPPVEPVRRNDHSKELTSDSPKLIGLSAFLLPMASFGVAVLLSGLAVTGVIYLLSYIRFRVHKG